MCPAGLGFIDAAVKTNYWRFERIEKIGIFTDLFFGKDDNL